MNYLTQIASDFDRDTEDYEEGEPRETQEERAERLLELRIDALRDQYAD